MSEDNVGRRAFLAIGAGVAGFTGCIGDGEPEQLGDGSGEIEETPEGGSAIRMQTATDTTAAYAGNQGIAAAVNENTDEVFIEARTSPGTEANIGALDSGEAEMVYIQNWSVVEVQEGVEPLDDLDFTLNQIIHYYDLPWFFCTANEELESITDIESETTVSPTPRGSGTAPAIEAALDYATEGYDVVSEDYGEQGPAMQEDRLDVGVGTYMNYEIVPGWLQEMMGTVDLGLIEVPEEVIDAWEENDRLQAGSFPSEELDGVAFAPEEVWGVEFSYNFVCRDDLDYDAVYDFLLVLYDNRGELSQYHALLAPLEDEEFWVENAYEDVPFHPAAADFYEEIGVWSEEFERGG